MIPEFVSRQREYFDEWLKSTSAWQIAAPNAAIALVAVRKHLQSARLGARLEGPVVAVRVTGPGWLSLSP